MSLPSDLTLITVTAEFPQIDGSPQDGTVTFDPGTPLRDITGKVILDGAATAQVRGSIMIPIDLPATDNATLMPGPDEWAYSVTVHLGRQATPYTFALPSVLAPTVDLSALVSIAAPAFGGGGSSGGGGGSGGGGTGPAGLTGATGATGPAGPAGPAGATGAT